MDVIVDGKNRTCIMFTAFDFCSAPLEGDRIVFRGTGGEVIASVPEKYVQYEDGIKDRFYDTGDER